MGAVNYMSAVWEGVQLRMTANCFRKAAFNKAENKANFIKVYVYFSILATVLVCVLYFSNS